MTPSTPRRHPPECAECGGPLQPHNLTRLCAECKLAARNRRITGQPPDTAEPVSHDQAITNVQQILGGRIISPIDGCDR